MDGLVIIDILKKINPWFEKNKIPASLIEEFKRREFEDLERSLEDISTATLIIGGRRVGKSVLMYQLMDSLLKKGVKSKNILFIQGDNPLFGVQMKEEKVLGELIDIFQRYIYEKPLDQIKETLYIFIDEAHALPDWELEVKSLIDLKYNIKFVITGSSSVKLRRGLQNPLTGRVNIHLITPFSFADFSRFQLPINERAGFKKDLLACSVEFDAALFEGDIKRASRAANSAIKLVNKYNLNKKIDDYLYLGGFPWVVSNHKGNDVSKYLRDLLTTTISKDILTRVEIRDTQAFERLMVNLCLSAGKQVSYKSLASVLGIDERSVIKFVDYYLESHWVHVSSPYTFHQKPDSVRTEKKVYVIDSGIINTLSFKDKTDLLQDSQYRGHLLENSIHNHLLAVKHRRQGAFQNSIPFWMDENTKKEIDFIFEIKGGKVVPIESKIKISHDGSDIDNLKEFMKTKSSAKFGIITTEDTLKEEENILFIPYVSFLLLL